MIKLIIRLGFLVAIAAGFAWLADQSGMLSLTIGENIIELPLVMAALAMLIGLFLLWMISVIISRIFNSPGAVFGFFSERKKRKGREALSRGLIAVGSGDAATAKRSAKTAAAAMPDEPLTKLLMAQTAQIRGDHKKVKQLFEDMRGVPETELMGLRGLYVQAMKDGNSAEADRLARRATTLNPAVDWASSAVLISQTRQGDWPALLASIEQRRKAQLIDDETARHKRAVVMTAQALAAEEVDQDAALDLANRAHRLDPSLVPAAVIVGRIQSSQGNLRKASKVLEKTWALSPHPDIAEVYMYARSGDSVGDRLVRMQQLRKVSRGGEEGAVALAVAAIDARKWKLARETLSEFLDTPRVRICTLMAEIEQGEFGDQGRAREWLARAVHAPRNPLWTADGYGAEEWAPFSPVSGELGSFEWKVPVEGIGYSTAGQDLDGELIAAILPPPPAENVEEEDLKATVPMVASVVATMAQNGQEKAAEVVLEDSEDQSAADETDIESDSEADEKSPIIENTEVATSDSADDAKEVAGDDDKNEITDVEDDSEDTAITSNGEADSDAENDTIVLEAKDDEEVEEASVKSDSDSTDGDSAEADIVDKTITPMRQPDDPGLDERAAKKRRGWFG